MGLDMYLQSKKQMKKNSWDSLAYWRKFNALHSWFVQNVQNGMDDCKGYRVSKDTLTTLVELLKQALADKDCSKLPTQCGFFFGSTDYDEEYWAKINSSVLELENILNTFDFKNDKLIYTASW